MARALGCMVLLLVLHVVFVRDTFAAKPDPCSRFEHGVISNTNRSIKVGYSASAPVDDAGLIERWYRFESPAGGYIPEICPGFAKCGTVNPVWINGSLPSDDGKTQTVRACYNNGVTCFKDCFWIDVKNCGKYAVYKLKGLTMTSSAYCAGSEEKCPVNTTSATGYTPCANPNSIPEKPSVPVLNIDTTDSRFYFQCALTNADENATHIVKWISDGNDMFEQTLPEGESSAILWEKEDKSEESKLNFRGASVLGTHIRCEVAARYATSNVTTPWVSSAKPGYFLGLQYVDKNGKEIKEVKVNEGDKDPAFVYLKNTVPVRCNSKKWTADNKSGFAFEGCLVSLKVDNPSLDKFAEQLAGTGGCNMREAKDLAKGIQFGDCLVKIKKTSWTDHSKHKLTIMAVNDNVNELSPQSRYVRLKPLPKYQEIWKGFDVPYLKVTAYDTRIPATGSTTCSSYNDPHLTTFDGFQYDNYLRGEFILYHNREFNFRVHVFYKACSPNSMVSCNCAVGAQAGDDVIIIDKCRSFGDIMGGQHADKSLLRTRVFRRGKLTPGFSLEHKTGTYIYEIAFPHGARVTINVYGNSGTVINVSMQPSQLDYSAPGKPRKVQGLCGVFSKDSTDDLTLKDGSKYIASQKDVIQGNPMSPKPRYVPDPFNKSWRVNRKKPGESMYSGLPVHSKPYNKQEFCACVKDREKILDDFVQCSFTNNCTKAIGARVAKKTALRRRRSADPDHDYVQDYEDSNWTFDYDETPVNLTGAWDKGWTEQRATQYCIDHFNRSAAVKACRGIPDVHEEKDLAMCIADIQLSGGPSFADSASESVTTKCRERVVSNEAMWKPDPKANATSGNDTVFLPPLDIVNVMCPADCSQRGHCVEGECVCDPGYIGGDCSREENKPPEVLMVPQKGLCDTTKRPCRSTPVLGDGFIDDNLLTCHIQTLEVTENGFRSTVEVHKTSPEFESFMELHCPLPTKHIRARRQAPVGTPAVGYNITISNNGQLQSVTSVNLLVYDSRCQACNSTSGLCTLKPNTCLIRGYCQLPGDRSDTNACLTCDPDKSTSGWTSVDNCPPSTTPPPVETTASGKAAKDAEDKDSFPVWAIAVICVAGGAVIAVAIVIAVRLLFFKNTSVAPPVYEEEMRKVQRDQLFEGSQTAPLYNQQ